MNWSFLLIAFLLAVIMGAAFAALLAQIRPQWSSGRRRFAAALALPCVTLLVTLVGVAVVLNSDPETGENMKDRALVAATTLGGFFAVLAFVGGLVGAAIAQKRRRP
jgi:cytosine/uracil/thiamine/allantoin permease